MLRTDQRGFSLAEIAFSMAILVLAALVMVNHLTSTHRRTGNNRDRVFAFQKAQAILAELQAYVDRGEAAAAVDLDGLDDGIVNKATLTISRESGTLVAPDHPLSGNTQRDGMWLFSRRITVRPFAGLNNRNVRYVTVRIFKRDQEGVEKGLAELSGVVNSVGSAFPSSQVFDVYFLAIESIPGWWVHMGAIKPFVEATITDLESRNPGCVVRTHWITKAGFGRNRRYMPYINEAGSSTDPIPFVYFYPGTMPVGEASTNYYVPDLFKARVMVDGTVNNDYDATTNPFPYALADRFNHAMRYPEEKALFDARLAAGQENDLEPTWRLLLDDMVANPSRYHNAILINLHGELLPMPSMRNFSDAAKAAEVAGLEGMRVVTHPERLRSVWDTNLALREDATLRVYAYHTNPNSVVPASAIMTFPISLQIMDVDLTANINGLGSRSLTIERLPGGVDIGAGVADYQPFQTSPSLATRTNPREMFYTAQYVTTPNERYTLIQLHNTPYRHQLVTRTMGGITTNKGVNNSTLARLYDQEYVPSSVEAANDFSVNLSSNGLGPKNTARWRIRVHKENFAAGRLANANQVLAIRTRMGNDMTTGQAFPPNLPENLSTTYVYWNNDKNLVPFSERYQWQGDPRHCPYADLKNNGATFPNGYNWYFDNFVNGTADARSSWLGYDYNRMQDGWLGRYEVDLPRHLLFLRTALTNAETIYTTLTGFSYYYVAYGNEIGYDAANGYANSIPVNGLPFGLASNTWVYTDSIATGGAAAQRYQKLVREATGANYWWGLHWLGELHPDTANGVSQFSTFGNLLAGSTVGTFCQAPAANVTTRLPYGTTLLNAVRRTSTEGCTTVFNIGTSASTFHHQFSSSTGSLEGAGLELAANYAFPVPNVASISRPFLLATNGAGGVGPEWNYTDTYPRFTANILKTFYRHTTGAEGSAVVSLTRPDGLRTARIVVNGIDKTLETGSAFIAKYAVLSQVHAFFEAGNPAVSNRFVLPPRITIQAPTEITELNDPATIAIQWRTTWTRWDGQSYTASTPANFAENEANLVYVLMYSIDNGQSWLQIEDNSPAVPGRLPTNPVYVHPDAGPGNETYSWPVPGTQFPEGTYVLRVEAYRNTEALHYSFHQSKIFINR